MDAIRLILKIELNLVLGGNIKHYPLFMVKRKKAALVFFRRLKLGLEALSSSVDPLDLIFLKLKSE